MITVFLFLIIILAAAAALWNWMLRQETLLQGLCYHLGAGSYQRGPWIRGTNSYSFSGRFLGRQFVVLYRYRPRNLGMAVTGELELQLPVLQKFWVRMRLRNLSPLSDENPRALTIDDDFIEPLYSVHSDQPEAAEKFLQSPPAQTAFKNFQHSFAKLEIHRGWFKLLFDDAAAQQFVPGDIEYLLDLVLPVIAIYEDQASLIKAVLILSPADEMVCPFCRGELDSRKETIVSCTQCRTRLHQACWKENGQCTTWGCKSAIANSL